MPPRTQVTPDDVIGAAATILDDAGFPALSVRAVANALGVSRQVVYTHFGGMHGLLDALHQRASRLLAMDVQAAEGDPGSLDHVLAMTDAYVAAARSRPAHYQLLFGPAVPGFEPSPASLEAGQRSFGVIVAGVDAYLRGDDADSTPDDPASWDREAMYLAQLTWSGVHGLVDLERVGLARAENTDMQAGDLVRRVLQTT